CFDSLSANPVGASILPLFVLGLILHLNRELILRDQPFAQFVLGGIASGAVPLLVLLLLLTTGRRPLVGWGTVWQLAVMALGGAAVAPLVFGLMGWLDHLLGQRQALEPTFRPDREIRRGRS